MVPVLNIHAPCKGSLIERMVFNGIVFNMSWEDPEMDRRAFDLTSDDTVISITSAGCNPLNFLCQSPKRLICVDGNPAQNAVMELKAAAIATVDHETFFDIFAARRPHRVLSIYRPLLRSRISPMSQKFWDRNLWKLSRGIYNYGRTGLFMRLVRMYLRMRGIRHEPLAAFAGCASLDEQAAFYRAHIEPKLWGKNTERLVNFRPFIYLAGVHPEQFSLIDGRHDMYAYVKERIDYVCTQVPIYDNYFLAQAMLGQFQGNRVPPYLLDENYETLRNNLDRVEIVNGWLGPYLDTQPAGSITKFNLLDIFDWMPPPIFEGTLRSVLRAAAPGATFIYRSGSYRLDPPESIRPHVEYREELSRELLAIDRSATYGSFYVFNVKDGYLDHLSRAGSNGHGQGARGTNGTGARHAQVAVSSMAGDEPYSRANGRRGKRRRFPRLRLRRRKEVAA